MYPQDLGVKNYCDKGSKSLFIFSELWDVGTAAQPDAKTRILWERVPHPVAYQEFLNGGPAPEKEAKP